jgi:hypothetical protein
MEVLPPCEIIVHFSFVLDQTSLKIDQISRKYNNMYNIKIVSSNPSYLDNASIWYYRCYYIFSINLVKIR